MVSVSVAQFKEKKKEAEPTSKQRVNRDKIEIFMLVLNALSKADAPLSTYRLAMAVYGPQYPNTCTRTRSYLAKLGATGAIEGYDEKDAERWEITGKGQLILKKYKAMMQLFPKVFKGEGVNSL